MEAIQKQLTNVQEAADRYGEDTEKQRELLLAIKNLQVAVEGPRGYASMLRMEVR